MSSCNCSCGSNCKCGDKCTCSRSELSYLATPTKSLVVGLSPMKENFEEFEMGAAGAVEGGCKCGDNCTCDPCNCK